MAASLPPPQATDAHPGTIVRWSGDRALVAVAAALIGYGAFWPIFGHPIGPPGQIAALLVTAVIGGAVVAPRGSRLAFMLLWSALGMACALGILGIFSVGVIFLAATVLIAPAIFAMPNRSGLAVRFDWRFIVAFYAGFLVLFLPILFLLLRDRAL